MSIIQEVAEWVHARTGGAISADVAAAFSLTVSKASIVMGQIHREARFTTRVEHFCMVGENGRGRHTRRLFVDQVRDPQWHKTPVIGINEEQQIVRFDSIVEAERTGGFVRVSITRCLNNSQATHGGYRWTVATNEQNG
ncbi:MULTISPECIES: hypothetical protein [Aeromonas]|uniref:hypothetical protein n=1 Tax=Aeromonas TaxID=642 RepID=UPI00090B42C7|nr:MULTISPECIES: hypothetical protein [Aeromonas]APJ15119.1 hypothetical protein BOQ57_09350 [Aeromonas hydrophila]MCE9956191.1 hypothetical protein [Aeromonas rivipollensis]